MTAFTQVITTEETSLTTVKSPALPFAPVQYDRAYQDTVHNILRQYFNQIDTLISQLRVGALNTLALPQGAFFQDGVTTLTAGISNADTTLPVADTSKFLSPGAVIIGSEIITYTGKTATSFTGCLRGQYGSSAAAHLSGVYVGEAQTPSGAVALYMSETTSSNGVTLDPADTSKIVFETAGYYNIQFSVQLLSFDNAVDNVTLWFSKNGTSIPYSAGIGTIPARISATKPATAIISWNLIVDVNANDYIQLYFASDSGNTLAVTYPPGVSPAHPISPSVILTATFTSALDI
jgi:hypothetical protein